MHSDLLSTKEACATLKCGMTKLYQMLNNGDLKAVKLGNRTFIPQREINAFINSLAAYSDRNRGGKNA